MKRLEDCPRRDVLERELRARGFGDESATLGLAMQIAYQRGLRDGRHEVCERSARGRRGPGERPAPTLRPRGAGA